MKPSKHIILLIFLLTIFTGCLSLDSSGPSYSSTLSKYKYAVQKYLHDIFHHEKPDIHDVDNVKNQISALKDRLKVEEDITRGLQVEKQTIQSRSLGWIFDAELRIQVESTQIKINQHIRIIEGIIDELNFHWTKIKPYYGLYSKSFFIEAFQFIPYLVGIFIYFAEVAIVFDVLSLIFFGPLAMFSVMLWIVIGSTFILSIFSYIAFFGGIYWLFHLPFIMIQYNPSVIEFLSIYVPVVISFLTFTSIFFRPRLLPTQKKVAPKLKVAPKAKVEAKVKRT